ncbi:MAG: hypothetical protein Q4C47_08085 [Planctomycetia bacterium]|nr:hypothetical protein [Planctomycetia bacterium]
MFSKLQSLFRNIRNIFGYGKTIGKIRGWIGSYPGVENSTALRTWLRPIVVEMTQLATESSFRFDDHVTEGLLRLLDHDRLWNIFHESVMMVVEYSSHENPDTSATVHSSTPVLTLIPVPDPESENEEDEPHDPARKLVLAAEQLRPENPVLVIAAAGLLLQFVQIAHRRHNRENQSGRRCR